MPDVKSGQRPTLRTERAAVTRRRIAESARTLFARHGYGATTLVAIAADAEVAVQTVYSVFGSKAGILRSLREEVLRQPDAEALFAAAIQAPSVELKLEFFARSIRQRWEYGHDIVAIHEDAASTDPSLRIEVNQVLAIRRAGIARLGRSLGPWLPTSMDVDRAAAILNALTLPAVYGELVDIQGWTPDEFEAWLAATLKEQLVER